MKLAYNAHDPLTILSSLTIKTSNIDRRDRGLSFSENLCLWSHGPFKFIFRDDREWYGQFTKCTYDHSKPFTFTNKNRIFESEQEWHSIKPVQFKLDDIEKMVFMARAPGARIYPIKSKRTWRKLQQLYFDLLPLEVDTKLYPPPDE
jgi:hypothetical protein